MSIPPRRAIVKEDAPQMRSVQIQSLTPAMAPPMPAPFAVGRTNLANNKIAAPKTQVALADKAWKVSQQLRPLPSYHRLERTHLKINTSEACCTDIAARIAECLRLESVSATFNDDEAIVEAATHDAVTFTTRLFAGEHKGAAVTIVELQRQAGCCYLFHQTAKSVLRAAKGMDRASKRRTYSIPPSVSRCDNQDEKECLEGGLEVAATLLKKDRLDAHLLAMESLTQLSRSSKCQCLIAKNILTGPLLDTLVSLIESWSVCASAVEEKGEVEEHHCAVMHRLAIAVLANCLTILESEGELESVLTAKREQLCAPSLLMALVEELRRADRRPHDACEAARCLQPLVRRCPECKPRLLECDGASAAKEAYEAGQTSHANLEKECHILQMEINSN